MIRDLKDGEILLLDNVRYCLRGADALRDEAAAHPRTAGARRCLWKSSRRWQISTSATHSPPRTATSPACAALSRCSPRRWAACLKRNTASSPNSMASPAKPCVFVLGGSKISDAFMMMETVLAQRRGRYRPHRRPRRQHPAAPPRAKPSARAAWISSTRATTANSSKKPRRSMPNMRTRSSFPTDLALRRKTARGKSVPSALFPRMSAPWTSAARPPGSIEAIILAAKTVFVNGPMGDLRAGRD